MHCKEAAEKSQFRKSFITLNDGRLEIYDEYSHSFFILSVESNLDRKIGRGSFKRDDWEPMSSEELHNRVEAWKAKQEDDRAIKPEKPWEEACMASPVNRAFRYKKDGLLMIRLGDRFTVSELPNGMVVPIEGPFKAYDNWEPMPADHFYAEIDFLPYSHNYGRRTEIKLDEPVEKPKRKYTKKTEPSEVKDETMVTAGLIAQSLAEAIKSTTGSDRSSLVEELKRLSSHVSWHLREDRAKYR